MEYRANLMLLLTELDTENGFIQIEFDFIIAVATQASGCCHF